MVLFYYYFDFVHTFEITNIIIPSWETAIIVKTSEHQPYVDSYMSIELELIFKTIPSINVTVSFWG